MSHLFHVMHVPGFPARERFVKDIAEQVPVCVHEDPKRLGAMWNWSQVMMCMARSPEPESHFHIQVNDDISMLGNWEHHLDQALANSPVEILGLAWIGSRRGDKAFQAGRAYAEGYHLPAGVAVAYEHRIVPLLARFSHYMALTGYRHDDAAMTTWAKEMGVTTGVVSRSIFGVHDVDSLMGHARYTTSVHTIETSPTSPAWDTGFVSDNYMDQREDEDMIMKVARAAGWKP